MLEKAEDIALLLWKHLNGDLLPNEELVLDEWLSRSEANRQLLEKLQNPEMLTKEFKNFYELWHMYGESMDEKFEKALPVKLVPIYPKRRRSLKWLAAASIILLVSVGSYLVLFKKENNVAIDTTPVAAINDVPPGTYKARLTLDDGNVIYIDKSSTGEITKQGNTLIANQDGQLVYSSQGSSASQLYNILTTARGETYPTVLSDGSKVWLNNESSIRYPVAFTGGSRVVELTGGEAYFEVAHNAAMPFKVLVNGTEVEVLGTQFCVSAFPDEETTKTSLLSGSVKISHNNANEKILVPGNQANIDKAGKISVVKEANVQGSIAFVHGLLHFEQADLPSVLRQLARWYDVDVIYSGQIPTGKIQGDLERNIPLSEVLQNLEQMTKVHLKIEGRKIVVNP